MGITLNLNKALFAPKFFPYLLDYSHRWEIYMGSAGSAKSYFITQKLQEIVIDIKTDIEFPNGLRPGENPGYSTKYIKNQRENIKEQ